MPTTDDQPIAYRRNGQLVCVPCSDSEDRDYPVQPRRGARCSICDEPITED
jgi:hypothetical protein